MTWEIIERANGQTIYRSRDAELRTCYAVSSDCRGVPVDPTGCLVVYSLAEARRQATAINRIEMSED